MTPEATIGMFALLDHWKLMLAQLQGQPLPELPVTPSRRIVAPPIPSPDEDAAALEAEQQAARVWRALASDTEGGSHD